jgi:asparagine synthase (glutamine-hydrolysing)
MCGISGFFGRGGRLSQILKMQAAQQHRGYDDDGVYIDPHRLCGLAHNRLSILDLSLAGRQPMATVDKTLHICFNGEIYNYLELKQELSADYDFLTDTDTEVLLAAYRKWGVNMLDRLNGMFALIIWDEHRKSGFAARDRFGVKPLFYYQSPDGYMLFASEIKALHRAGVRRAPNQKIWAEYLAYGVTDHRNETFWNGIYKLPAGHFLKWENGYSAIYKWYDLAEKSGTDYDTRPEETVGEEYLELMKDSVRLRFRADVPIGVNLSGGTDSSALLGLIHTLEKDESEVAAYTFATGDSRYDELPWVKRMLEETRHPLTVSVLSSRDVPRLACAVQKFQDEPFGGIPTLAYAKLFEQARRRGTIVLLDGNGLDEQWAGYNYYNSTDQAHKTSVVQGTKESATHPAAILPELRALGEKPEYFEPFPDRLRNLQYRDAIYTKIPRAMRYNDRISMRASTELREPFLDYRLFELALKQPPSRKISGGVQKVLLRKIIKNFVPEHVRCAPKRPLQTPQREWLCGELRDWADDLISVALKRFGGIWLDKAVVKSEWEKFCNGASDNSFYIWQWISIGLMDEQLTEAEMKIELHHNQSSVTRQAV